MELASERSLRGRMNSRLVLVFVVDGLRPDAITPEAIGVSSTRPGWASASGPSAFATPIALQNTTTPRRSAAASTASSAPEVTSGRSVRVGQSTTWTRIARMPGRAR